MRKEISNSVFGGDLVLTILKGASRRFSFPLFFLFFFFEP